VDDEKLADLHDLHASLRFKPVALAELVEDTRRLLATRNISQPFAVAEASGGAATRSL
jgi:hypothetical protein